LTEPATAALKLLEYCEARDWGGYDPYDALNSPLAKVPLANTRLGRIALIQALKRIPVNVRPLLLVPPTQNAKAVALFLSAALRMPLLESRRQTLVRRLTDLLVRLRSPEADYWCWGYSFPWQTRTILVPRGAPNLVCTTFVANALLDLHERFDDQSCLEMAVSAATYLRDQLYWTDGDSAGFSYPLPSTRVHVHNANLLGAALLSRVARLSGENRFIEPALRVARYSASRQRTDGAWVYGEAKTQGWIDNFHTGYNLCALRDIGRHLHTKEFSEQIARGFEFYRAYFVRSDHVAPYYHDKIYPIDIHSVAQTIITLVTFRDVDSANLQRAHNVLEWAMRHMWDDRGFFYYRVLRCCTIRTAYMRWSQAWMLLAMSILLNGFEEVPG